MGLIPSLSGLETALSGLEADQLAIDTTGQNITNANTPGYSRQVVNLQTNPSMILPAESSLTGDGVQVGTGVDASQINRIRNLFLDVQFRAQNTTLGSATTNATQLAQAQAAFAEPGSTGLSAQMAQFFSDWSTVANAPTSTAASQALVDDATTMTQTFNQLSGQLSTVQTQAAQQYATLTGTGGQVQTDAQQIAALNGAIYNAKAAGQSPNNLMDQRDSLLDDLSSLGHVSVTDPGNGLLSVSFGDASTPLVNGTTVTWPQTLTSASGGQLGALLSLSSPSGPVGQFSSALDTVASQLASSVNALHTATPFFSGNTAATLAVAVTPAQVQTSSTSAAGGNDVAIAIAGLAGGTADQSYAALVAQVGSAVAGANTQQTNSQALVTAVDNQRQSTSGVSLDQEMTNLMTYQRGYEASARALTTMDAMLQQLINQTGTVGL
jgi:flagellar hook-associated protein 1